MSNKDERSGYDRYVDIWSVSLGFEHVGRIIDLAADFALEPRILRSDNNYDETLYSLLSGAAALNRETLAKLEELGERQRLESRNAGEK